MITQAYLNNEIDLANRIFIYYTDQMLNYLSVNSLKYKQWYIDSLQIEYLLGILEAITLDGDDNYLGYTTISDDVVLNVFYRVREYWKEDVDNDYILTDLGDIVIPTGPTYQPYTSDWKEAIVTITSDTTTEFVLPFNTAVVDLESIIVTVNDMDPVNITDESENGYHITGNTLYWHNYYDLNAGDKVFIKYKQILG